MVGDLNRPLLKMISQQAGLSEDEFHAEGRSLAARDARDAASAGPLRRRRAPGKLPDGALSSRESGDREPGADKRLERRSPEPSCALWLWMPAFAGMTMSGISSVGNVGVFLQRNPAFRYPALRLATEYMPVVRNSVGLRP